MRIRLGFIIPGRSSSLLDAQGEAAVSDHKFDWALDELWSRRLRPRRHRPWPSPAPRGCATEFRGSGSFAPGRRRPPGASPASAGRRRIQRAGDLWRRRGGAYGAGAGGPRPGRMPSPVRHRHRGEHGRLDRAVRLSGPGVDQRLKEAYTGGRAAEQFRWTALVACLQGGLLTAESLDGLIAPFIDEALVDAVAVEHSRDRRLLIATTDLDSQRPSIWDMGEIARRADPPPWRCSGWFSPPRPACQACFRRG